MTSAVTDDATEQNVFGGVDSHADTLHIAVISDNGGHLADAEFPTTAAGYAAALAFLTAHGHVIAVGVEGTPSYGTGFTRTARSRELHVVEINRPDRAERRRIGKSDPIDAYAAARAALSGRASSAPKDDTVAGIRAPHNAARSAVKARTAALNQIGHILISAPEAIRAKYGPLKGTDRTAALARLRPAGDTIHVAVLVVLKRLARRVTELTAEHEALTSATIAPNILHYLVRVTDAYGVDLQPQLNSVGLGLKVMDSAELRVSYRQGSDVIRQAVELTGDEHLGLRVGAAQHLTAWGLLGFAMMAADTQEEAIETGVRYQNLSGAMTVWSARWEDVGYVLCADLPDPVLDPTVAVFLIEEAYSSVVTLIRLSLGAAFAPQAVELTFPAPRDTGPFDELFRCPLRFDAARNRMVIPTRWARAAMPGRNPITYASVLDVLEKHMTSRREQQDLLEVLEISIAQSLPAIPSFLEQARRHASSERTLRRRLAECGTTYEAIVDGVRRERVEQLLDDGN